MLDKDRIARIIKGALKEDIGPIDVTTANLIQKNVKARADIITREDGIAAGLPICEVIFEYLDKDIKFRPQVKDGDPIYKDKVLCYLEGPARGILTGERAALNFLSYLSGIATKTNAFVKICAPYGVKVMDTRKTTPNLRYLEKYAVKAGGGYNHRMGLWDQVLIKDNHLKVIDCKKDKMVRIVKEMRKSVQKNIKIEIEVNDLEEFESALKGRPDIIMLDNFKAGDVKKAIGIRKKLGIKTIIEVSGNITLDTIESYAKEKPDVISIGSITHSVKSLDLSLEIYG